MIRMKARKKLSVDRKICVVPSFFYIVQQTDLDVKRYLNCSCEYRIYSTLRVVEEV